MALVVIKTEKEDMKMDVGEGEMGSGYCHILLFTQMKILKNKKFGLFLCAYFPGEMCKVQSRLPGTVLCVQKPWCQGQKCVLSSSILISNRWLHWSKPLLRVSEVYNSCAGCNRAIWVLYYFGF